ncbi:unnamed protein product [Caretta caretta]
MRDDFPRRGWERLKNGFFHCRGFCQGLFLRLWQERTIVTALASQTPPTELICIDAAARRRRGKDASAAGRGKNEAGWEERDVEVSRNSSMTLIQMDNTRNLLLVDSQQALLGKCVNQFDQVQELCWKTQILAKLRLPLGSGQQLR